MKNSHVLIVIGMIVSMLFLQLSCAGIKERKEAEAPAALEDQQVDETTAAVEPAAEEAGLLAGMHESAGISCGDCHAESPPAIAVPEAACLTCHGDYRELTAGMYEDPHNAHIVYPDCGSCHHMHRPSENQCLMCHAF